jgi:hypothetical protein
MESDTPLRVEKKTLRSDRSGRTAIKASSAIFTVFHHLRFLPGLFLAGKIRIKSHKPMKTSHSRNVTDIVFSIRAQSTACGQEL